MQANLTGEAARELVEERLQVFSAVISAKLKDYISGRDAQGIESEWLADEEAYEGIDDANRDTEARIREKPLADGIGVRTPRISSTRSNAYLNVLRPYVDAVSARVGDMLLGDWPWSMKPTPMPEMSKSVDDQKMITLPDGQVGKKGDIAKMILEEAARKSEKAETQVKDWHVESQWTLEARLVIDDVCRLGTGILKGPFPTKKQSKTWNTQDGVTSLIVEEKIVPKSKRINPRNFYPDPACGDNIHNGNGTFERDTITAKQLKDLKGVPGYFKGQIDKAIAEGPKLATQEAKKDAKSVSDKDQYEIWYFYGSVNSKDLSDLGCECDESDSAFALVTLVNDRVIKATLNPLDTGEFPYDLMVYQRRSGMPWGSGVTYQGRVPQRMINAAVRNLMDNAGLGSGPQIVIKDGKLFPADGVNEITPRKLWKVAEDAEGPVSDYFHAEVIPIIEAELMAIIQFAQKMLEDITGLPMLLQGQMGSAPDTVGGMTMLNNNASAVLRRIARLFDALVTEPHIRRYYDWLMQHGEDEDAKGDFQIQAIGSTTLVERDIQKQELAAMGNIAINPAFGLDPKKYIAEYLKSRGFDPERFQYTEEEIRNLQEQAKANPPPQDPRVEVANIKVRAEAEKEQYRAKMNEQKVVFAAREAERDRQLDLYIAKIKQNMETLKLSGANKIAFDKMKAMLASEAMKIRNKTRLYDAEQNLKLKMGSGI